METMNTLSPDEEIERILGLLSENPGLQLREIHDKLKAMSESSFKHSPPRGEGYNVERYILKGLIEFLSVKEDLISADGTKWSLTEKGRRKAS